MDLIKFRKFLNGEISVDFLTEIIRKEQLVYENEGKTTILKFENDADCEQVPLEAGHVYKIYDAFISGKISESDAEYLMALIVDTKAFNYLPDSDPDRDLLRMLMYFTSPDPKFPVSKENAEALKSWLQNRKK